VAAFVATNTGGGNVSLKDTIAVALGAVSTGGGNLAVTDRAGVADGGTVN